MDTHLASHTHLGGHPTDGTEDAGAQQHDSEPVQEMTRAGCEESSLKCTLLLQEAVLTSLPCPGGTRWPPLAFYSKNTLHIPGA